MLFYIIVKCLISFIFQAIRFFMSSNLTVKGVRVKNSPQFHFRFDGCQNVHIESLSIKSPAHSPNTDGIHIENTNNVRIYNSLISNGNYYKLLLMQSNSFSMCHSQKAHFALWFLIFVAGDDCVSIGAGCYNIDIKNITCGPSHGIRYSPA